ncbi:hypothetical protein DFQ26_000513 [Actinomortierella ambigua]|nr:hypothetical protein DFQ26_000513 [Actinomortierella ambigua]
MSPRVNTVLSHAEQTLSKRQYLVVKNNLSDIKLDPWGSDHPYEREKQSRRRATTAAKNRRPLWSRVTVALLLAACGFTFSAFYRRQHIRPYIQQDKTVLPIRAILNDERFLVMDYSPWLGFNNMRYMLERGLYIAGLSNRTLVIPTHLRIRQCADLKVCLQVASPLRLDRIGHNPQASTMELEMGYFFDLPHLDRYLSDQSSPPHQQQRVLDFRSFMERMVGVPKGVSLLDNEYAAQIAYWQRVLEARHSGAESRGSDKINAEDSNGFIIRDGDGDDDDDGDDGSGGDYHFKDEVLGDSRDKVNTAPQEQGQVVEQAFQESKDAIPSPHDMMQHSSGHRYHRLSAAAAKQQPRLAPADFVRIKRSSWYLPGRPDTPYVDDLIRNVLVDTIPELEIPDNTDTLQQQQQQQHDTASGRRRVRKTFYTFCDVRGGGLHKLVHWSVDLDLHPPPLSLADESHHHRHWRQRKRPLYRPEPDLTKCQPPADDDDDIPGEARFPGFATCKITNYVGLRQELGFSSSSSSSSSSSPSSHSSSVEDRRVLAIEGQFHVTGWIPLAFGSRDDAERYRTLAVRGLKYAPVVYEAAAYLRERLRERLLPAEQRGEEEVVEEQEGNDDHDKQRTEKMESSTSSSSSSSSPKKNWLRLAMHVRRGDFVTDGYGWQEFDDGWMLGRVEDAVRSAGLLPDEDSNQSSSPSSSSPSSSAGPGAGDEQQQQAWASLSSSSPPSQREPTNKEGHSHSNNNNINNNNSPPDAVGGVVQSHPSTFFLVTDETHPALLASFRSLGAVLTDDLIDTHFHTRYGHLAVFKDWMGLVEQLLCSEADKFVGTMSSSFTSGILNRRVVELGMDSDEQHFAFLTR